MFILPLVALALEVTISPPLSPRRLNLGDADLRAGDLLYTGTQVAPALIYHNWTDTAIVAWGEGRWARCAGTAALCAIRAGEDEAWCVRADDLHAACLGAPFLALSGDGDVVLLGADRHEHLGPVLFESLDHGRTWTELHLAFRDEILLDLQPVGARGMALLTRSSSGLNLRFSDDGGRHWILPRSSSQLFPETRGAHVILTQCSDRWLLADETGNLWASVSGGRSWNPVPLIAGFLSPWVGSGMNVLSDGAVQPRGYDALAFDTHHHPMVKGNDTAQLYDGVRIRPLVGECRAKPWRILNGWPMVNTGGCPLFKAHTIAARDDTKDPLLVDGRSCRLATSATPSNQTLPLCLPDGSRLATSFWRVPRHQPIPRISADVDDECGSNTLPDQPVPHGPALLRAVTEDGKGRRAFLLQQVVPDGQNFTVDLLLHVWWNEVAVLQRHYDARRLPSIPERGYYEADDFGRGLLALRTRGFLVAYTTVDDSFHHGVGGSSTRRDDMPRSFVRLARVT